MNSPYRQAPEAEEGLCECRFALGHNVCKRCHRQIAFGRRDGLYRVVRHTVLGVGFIAAVLFYPSAYGSQHPTECCVLSFVTAVGYVLSSVLLKRAYERYLGEKVPEPLDNR